MSIAERIAARPSERAHMLSAKGVETLAAARTVTLAELDTYNAFAFDPGGANRNVDLPAEASCKGMFFFIRNSADAAEDLVVRNDAPATVITVSQNECGLLWCDGTSWFGFVGANT